MPPFTSKDERYAMAAYKYKLQWRFGGYPIVSRKQHSVFSKELINHSLESLEFYRLVEENVRIPVKWDGK